MKPRSAGDFIRLDFSARRMRFELDHLASYDDGALLAELKRVAALVPAKTLTVRQFNAHAKVHASTLQKRFGSWKSALEAAGLSDRFDDGFIPWSKEELLTAIRQAAETLRKPVLTRQEFIAHTGISDGPVRRSFGSWKAALAAAGLDQSALGRRYTDEQCFENLLAVWTHYGRAPQHDEMNAAPSKVGAKAYVWRWGTWRKALAAFVSRVNDPESQPAVVAVHVSTGNRGNASEADDRGPRDIPLALRYFILRRDSFRCVLCGRSPATEHGLVLHVDHIEPWVKGGRTVVGNLRTLCSSCNLGKGSTLEREI